MTQEPSEIQTQPQPVWQVQVQADTILAQAFSELHEKT